jgi:DNA-binding MarR family transcriptional regulator
MLDRFAFWLQSIAARFKLLFPIAAVLFCSMVMVLPGAVAGPVTDQASDGEGPIAAPEASAGGDAASSDVVDRDSSTVGWHEAPAFMAPLYLRIPEPELLNSSLRAQIFSFVERNPGATFSQIQARVRAAPGTVQHHLRVLVRGEVLRKVRTGKFTRYYPANTPANRLSPPEEKVVMALFKEGPVTQADLAKLLGMSRQLVHYHVSKLEDRGYVVKQHCKGGPVIHLAISMPSKMPSGCF